MIKKIKIKYCPFCDGIVDVFPMRLFDDKKVTYFKCRDCGAVMSFVGKNNIGEELEAFNRRVNNEKCTYQH